MYCSLSPNDHGSRNILSKNEGDNDISSVMSKIRTHTSRILSKYLDLVLYKFTPVYNKQIGFDPSSLSYNPPVLCRYRNTNVPYSTNLFHLGLIDQPNKWRLRKFCNILIRAVKNDKIKVLNVFKEDIISLIWDDKRLDVTENELLSSFGLKS